MELDKIIDALKDKDIDGAVITAIKALDNSGDVERLTAELKAEQGKASGILEDKKRYKTERDAHKSALDKIETDKLPDADKHQKQLDDMQKKIDDGEALRVQNDAKFAKTQRDNTELGITAKIKWGANVPQDTAALLVKNALAGVEDLSDDSKVSGVIKSLTESHASFISADAPSGSGGGGDGGDGGGGSKETTHTLGSAVAGAWNK